MPLFLKGHDFFMDTIYKRLAELRGELRELGYLPSRGDPPPDKRLASVEAPASQDQKPARNQTSSFRQTQYNRREGGRA